MRLKRGCREIDRENARGGGEREAVGSDLEAGGKHQAGSQQDE